MIVFWHDFANKTVLTTDDQTFVVELDMVQLKLDGNQLQVVGKVLEKSDGKPVSENIVIFYQLQSEEEKESWLKKPATVTVLAEGELTAPDKARNPYQFDYRHYLYRQKVHWTLSVSSLMSVKDPAENEFSIQQARQSVLQHIDQTVSSKAANYMKTLLFADSAAFDKEVREHFKETGIVHLLSISGLHIHFFVFLLSYVLLRTGITRERSFYFLVVILALYGGLAGGGPSVFRALMMTFLTLTAAHFRIHFSRLDAWSFTLIFALWINPYQVFSAGFQLSYLLSLMLLVLSPSFLNASRSAFLNSFFVTFVLLLTSVPILSYHYFEFSWFGIFANLLFVPLFTRLVLPLLILLFILSFIMPHVLVYQLLLDSAERLLNLIERTILFLSELPFTTIVTGRFSAVSFVLLGASLVFFFIALEQKKRRKRGAILVLLVFLLVLAYQKFSPFGQVIVLDVGQGDAILIQEPFGQGTYLIDTGGTLSFEKEEWETRDHPSTVANRILIPALKAQGIGKLDQVFITHGDEDHMGALLELSQNCAIKELVFPKGSLEKKFFRDVILEMARNGVTVSQVVADGQKLEKVNESLAIVWPFVAGKGENNDSMVLYGSFGTLTWLFTGDLEEEGEYELLAHYPFLSVDALKVGHHGSLTSSSEEFLQNYRPKLALISCGLNNRYNHPHPEVLGRLEQIGAKVYRTDQQGAIVYRYSAFTRDRIYGHLDPIR